MKQIRFIPALFIILMIACSSREMKIPGLEKNKTAAYNVEETEKEPPPPPPPGAAEGQNMKDEAKSAVDGITSKKENVIKKDIKKIIKTADVSIEVIDYSKVKAAIAKAVESQKAYISRENEENNDYKISNSIDIRVPSENFEKLADALVELARKLDYKRVNATDVTDEYYDIQTRLESNRRVEQSYLDLLKRTGTIGEILEVQSKLGQIREEIESKEGRIKRMDDQVAYSTITLQYYELHDFKYIPEKSPGFFTRLAKALDHGWQGFVSFFIGLFYLWPLWILSAITWFLIRKWLRKRKKKKAEAARN